MGIIDLLSKPEVKQNLKINTSEEESKLESVVYDLAEHSFERGVIPQLGFEHKNIVHAVFPHIQNQYSEDFFFDVINYSLDRMHNAQVIRGSKECIARESKDSNALTHMLEAGEILWSHLKHVHSDQMDPLIAHLSVAIAGNHDVGEDGPKELKNFIPELYLFNSKFGRLAAFNGKRYVVNYDKPITNFVEKQILSLDPSINDRSHIIKRGIDALMDVPLILGQDVELLRPEIKVLEDEFSMLLDNSEFIDIPEGKHFREYLIPYIHGKIYDKYTARMADRDLTILNSTTINPNKKLYLAPIKLSDILQNLDDRQEMDGEARRKQLAKNNRSLSVLLPITDKIGISEIERLGDRVTFYQLFSTTYEMEKFQDLSKRERSSNYDKLVKIRQDAFEYLPRLEKYGLTQQDFYTNFEKQELLKGQGI